jgi:hypothetical protein
VNRSIALFGIVLVGGTAAAAAPTPLLTAGSAVLTLADAELLLSQSPPLAASPDKLDPLTSWVSDVLIPRFVVDIFARRLERTERFRPIQDALLARLIEGDLRGRSHIADADVTAYYDRHASAFAQPEAFLLSRILVATEAQARALIHTLSAPAGLEQWGALVREHSLDTATKLRNGRLGFVRSDGTTDVPQVRANPTLYRAALPLHDGQLAPQPVAEGSNFAVVWRRATRPAETQPLPTVAPTIQGLLQREQLQAARAQLLTDLRSRYLTAYHPEVIEALNYPAESGLPIQKRALTQKAAAVVSKPVLGDRGER